MVKTDYDDIKALFLSKECSLLTTKEQYDDHMTKQDKFKYIAKCGHESEVYCTNFMNNSGINCPQCALTEAMKNTLITSKKQLPNKDIIKLFTTIIKDTFDWKLTFDKYAACDVFIKPKNIKGNWLRVLVRYSVSDKKFSFSTNPEIPSYIVVGLTAVNKTYIIPSSDVTAKIIQISNDKKSKYEGYRVKDEKIIKKLLKYYNSIDLVNEDDDAKYVKIEHNTKYMNVAMDYDEINRRFSEKSCLLLTTKDDFINNQNDTKSKLLVKMQCEHDSKKENV